VYIEWDPEKALKNLSKRGVSFEEVSTVFGDPLCATAPDPDHSSDEYRYITIGLFVRSRLIMVSHADRGRRVRIISARQLTRAERIAYEEETQDWNAKRASAGV
jgi:hypothetical protein